QGSAHTGNPTPTRIAGLSNVRTVVSSISHAIALKNDGTVWQWGDTYANSEHVDWNLSSPVQVPGLDDVISITASEIFDYNYALKADGSLWAWGQNFDGQLGDGTTETRSIPVQVAGLSNVTSVVSGTASTYALQADGSLWAWGGNRSGQLGDGTTVNRPLPAKVAGLSNVTSLVATSATSVYALQADGSLWAWGSNSKGQLGEGTYQNRSTPVQVLPNQTVTSITAGGGTAFAIVRQLTPPT
ncbi:MAG: hypothetical protein LBG70_00370, partial [Bifidobacteriaceae bacterium]|nr:hypothetical protein [Bifidobacteriaceae bacterium]